MKVSKHKPAFAPITIVLESSYELTQLLQMVSEFRVRSGQPLAQNDFAMELYNALERIHRML